MKRFLGFTVALFVLLTMSLYAGGSQEPSKAAGGKTVTIWGWRTQDAPLWKEVNTRLAKQGDKVTIKYESFVPTEYDSKALVALQGGTGPDILYTRRLPGQRTQALIENHYIESLTGKVDLSNFTEQTLNSLSLDGKAWGIPFANQVTGIFYNKDMFAKYNLQIPKTWNDLLTIAKTLKSNGITPFFISGKAGWTLAMQNAMVGVSLPGESWIQQVTDGKTTFTSAPYVDMLTKLNNLTQYYQKDFLANSTEDMDAAFALGKAGMVFYGIWAGTNWKKLNPDFNYGFFPVPPEKAGQPERVYVYMDGGYGLNSASKSKDAALTVLKYAATKEFGNLFSQITGELTAVKGSTIPASNAIGQLCYKDSTTIAAKYIYWVGSPFQKGTPTVYDILQKDMQSMYAGNITPAQLAKKIQDGISTWYPAFKK